MICRFDSRISCGLHRACDCEFCPHNPNMPHYQKEYNERILILLESILEELENIREVLDDAT